MAQQRMIAAPNRTAREKLQRLEENYLFSTRRFGAGAVAVGEYPLFQYGLGTDASAAGFTSTTANEAMTNLEGSGGKVAKGLSFMFSQIGVQIVGSATDVQQLAHSVALRFEKTTSNFVLKHGPLAFWPGGGGMSATGAFGAGVTVANNGDTDLRAVRTLKVPRVLLEEEVFNYKLLVGPDLLGAAFPLPAVTLAAPAIVRVWLWGGQQNAIAS